MGSTQSDITCEKCKFPYAMEEYYYKTGEVWVFCPRCGFNLSAFIEIDKNRGLRVLEQVKQLIKEDKIEEALKVSHSDGWVSHRQVDGEWKDVNIKDWSREEQLKTLLDESHYTRWFKLDDKGERVWEVKRTGGFGAYMHRNKRGGGTGGAFPTKITAKKSIKEMKKAIKSKSRKDQTLVYTKKLNGKWFMIDARTDEKVEIPNDIGYLIWMRRNNGNLKPLTICQDCKGNGGIKLEGSDEKSWQKCETCKGEGVLE